MFCHKCGAQVPEGSAFCPKCGEKLITGDAPVALGTTVAPETASATRPAGSAATETGEIYALLKAGLSGCPGIKAVSPAPKGSATIVKGTVYNYIANTVNGQIKLGQVLTGPFIIPFALIGGFLAWLASGMGWDIMEGSFYFEDHAPTLSAGLLVIGLFLAVVSFFGEKEAGVVLPYIRKALEPREIGAPTDEKRKRAYKVTVLSGIACAFAGMVILVLVLSGDALPPNYEPVDSVNNALSPTTADADSANNPPSPTTSDADAESITLDQTYTNDAEGFSFRYPDTWTESAELDDGVVVQVTYAGMLGTYAGVSVAKSFADSALFDYTESDIQEMLSLQMDEVSISELSNIDFHGNPARKVTWSFFNENDEQIIVESYMYNSGDSFYNIQCAAIQSSYDNHKGTFDAIIESYAITDGGGSAGQGASVGDGPVADPDEAYNIAQAWLDAHPDMGTGISGGSGSLYTEEDGEEYYLFYLEEMHWLDLLVHGKTGNLYIKQYDDGEYPAPPVIEPLDDYYNRFYGTSDSSGDTYGYGGGVGGNDFGFNRTDYFTGLTHTDLLRNGEPQSKVYFRALKIVQVYEPKLYLTQDIISNAYFIIDDRINTGSNGTVDSLVAVYGTFSGIQMVTWDNGRSDQVPYINADRTFYSFDTPTDLVDFARGMVENMNADPYGLTRNNQYLGGTKVKINAAAHMRGSSSVEVWYVQKSELYGSRSLRNIDGYSADLTFTAPASLADYGITLQESLVGIEIPDTYLWITGNIVSVERSDNVLESLGGLGLPGSILVTMEVENIELME
jgi:hypothetical protein